MKVPVHGCSYPRDERSDRQERIRGWDQRKLTEARALVLGAGPLGQLLGIGLAALGMGTVDLVDGEAIPEEFGSGLLRLVAQSGQSRASALAALLRKVNPRVHVIPHCFAVRHEVALRLMTLPSLIIDATNDPLSKRAALQYAQRQQIPIFSGAATQTRAALSVQLPQQSARSSKIAQELDNYEGQPQSWATSMVIAGLLLEEVRKWVMPLHDEELPVDHPIVYNRQSENRFACEKQFTLSNDADYRSHCLVIGAGALSTWLCMELALHSVDKLTVADPQTVELSNLNRQVLYYDSIGAYKSRSLAEKLKQINPRVDCEALVQAASEEYFDAHQPNVIFVTADNFKARQLMNRIATERKIPLISGGTNAHAGQLVTYVPGESACLECQLQVSELALEEEERERLAGCAQTPQPSVAATNALIGGLMAAEAGPVLAPAAYGKPVKGIIEYRSLLPERIGIRSLRPPCDCHG